VVAVTVEVDTVATERYGAVAAVDVAASFDDASGSLSIFLVNRSLDDDAEVTIDLHAVVSARPGLAVTSALTLADRDRDARNTLTEPLRVSPTANATVTLDSGELSIVLPAVSWTVLTLGSGATGAAVTATI
jgi:alpha-N-arabinofuranosidase